jgi:hypothetical protein
MFVISPSLSPNPRLLSKSHLLLPRLPWPVLLRLRSMLPRPALPSKWYGLSLLHTKLNIFALKNRHYVLLQPPLDDEPPPPLPTLKPAFSADSYFAKAPPPVSSRVPTPLQINLQLAILDREQRFWQTVVTVFLALFMMVAPVFVVLAYFVSIGFD